MSAPSLTLESAVAPFPDLSGWKWRLLDDDGHAVHKWTPESRPEVVLIAEKEGETERIVVPLQVGSLELAEEVARLARALLDELNTLPPAQWECGHQHRVQMRFGRRLDRKLVCTRCGLVEDDWRWMVVVAPRGDIVRLAKRYCDYEDAASLFGMSLVGETDRGPITVRGSHVTCAWRSSEAKSEP